MSITQRIVMPPGHVELSIGGVNYKIDDTGAFEVPVEAVEELKTTHGGVISPGLNQLQANLLFADTAVAHAKAQLEALLVTQAAQRKALDLFKSQQKARDDEALKAANAKKAEEDAQEKQLAALVAGNVAKVPPLGIPKR